MNNNLNNLLNQNNQVKKEIAKYSFGKIPFLDDSMLRGSYRVTRTIKERNAIDCCHRKLGMKVMVIGQDYSFKEYTLQGEDLCSNNNWVLAELGSGIGTITDGDITLLDDYSNLDITQEILTQQDLNHALVEIITNLLQNATIGDKNHVHVQSIPSQTWYVEHGLNKKPSVASVDFGDNEIKGDVKYNTNNSYTITFATPESGRAYSN